MSVAVIKHNTSSDSSSSFIPSLTVFIQWVSFILFVLKYSSASFLTNIWCIRVKHLVHCLINYASLFINSPKIWYNQLFFSFSLKVSGIFLMLYWLWHSIVIISSLVTFLFSAKIGNASTYGNGLLSSGSLFFQLLFYFIFFPFFFACSEACVASIFMVLLCVLGWCAKSQDNLVQYVIISQMSQNSWWTKCNCYALSFPLFPRYVLPFLVIFI